METNKRYVIDTNVLLVSISSKSQYHWIFQRLIHQDFELSITTDILSEYEEIISNKYSATVARNVIRTLLLLPNVIQTNVYYNWNLITNDRDDDKFVDCAIASNADAIITHDKHFNIIKNISFPPINIINISEFKAILNKQL
ncbi:putative toxin-antitoxin system toxin component, PIN family [Candidatus Magnetomoraceae bacterium gMMP-15]